jgi:hypothetical protein
LSGETPSAKIRRRVCYALKIVYSSLVVEGARMRDGIDRATLQKLMASAGVKPVSEEVDAALQSLARIQVAAASLLQSPSFNEIGERFYRLLEIDAAGEAGR